MDKLFIIDEKGHKLYEKDILKIFKTKDKTIHIQSEQLEKKGKIIEKLSKYILDELSCPWAQELNVEKDCFSKCRNKDNPNICWIKWAEEEIKL
jgi:hypothetical protein